ncbi:hypothetical protein GJ744_000209 [Endocarpon pusillum]|uniref:Uncharacterized protein n=1 Tax=Endocarpon pusillum TaxID=364733 RepID=A0A8H7AU51_9EURO|nr:hypothetical protein GJ744_000209 [Endocarpon pusillum]
MHNHFLAAGTTMIPLMQLMHGGERSLHFSRRGGSRYIKLQSDHQWRYSVGLDDQLERLFDPPFTLGSARAAPLVLFEKVIRQSLMPNPRPRYTATFVRKQASALGDKDAENRGFNPRWGVLRARQHAHGTRT